MNANVQQLITQSAELMFIGMGAVFIILVLLISVITLVSRLVQRYAPEEPAGFPQRPSGSAASREDRPGGNDEETIAVIGAAIRAWRRKQP